MYYLKFNESKHHDHIESHLPIVGIRLVVSRDFIVIIVSTAVVTSHADGLFVLEDVVVVSTQRFVGIKAYYRHSPAQKKKFPFTWAYDTESQYHLLAYKHVTYAKNMRATDMWGPELTVPHTSALHD